MDQDMETEQSIVLANGDNLLIRNRAHFRVISGQNSGIQVSLHPMVILSISEYYTRTIVQNPSADVTKIFGALIGKHQGRNIEICNSYELIGVDLGRDVELDLEYFDSKERQYKQVFPDYDFVGWFSVGDDITVFDIDMHGKLVEKFSENPLILKLNPSNMTDTLPVKVYETTINEPRMDVSEIDDPPLICFSEVTVNLITEDSEKIVLDHLAQNTNQSGDGSSPSMVDHLRIQYRAVKMLHSRIKMILDFIEDAEKNSMPINHKILFELSLMAKRIQMPPLKECGEDFFVQCNDTVLVTYLGALTKCSTTMNKFITLFNSFLPERSTPRRRPFQ